MKKPTKHLLTLSDLSAGEIESILQQAAALKRLRQCSGAPASLAEKSIAMIFSKSSTRTRVSFEVGIHELGGHSMFFDKNDLQLGRGESVSDTAQVLSRYVHGVVIRTHAHEEIEVFAQNASIPVINALTDRYHPCQLLADMQTIIEYQGGLQDVQVCYLGDGASNMANSWILAARMMGMNLRIGAPKSYQPAQEIVNAATGPGTVRITDDPQEAVSGAQFLYTDVWVSMGFEEEKAERLQRLAPYQLNAELLAQAAPGARVMHCLPAYRGQEITAEVLDGPASIIWDEAENRLHAQKAVMCHLLG